MKESLDFKKENNNSALDFIKKMSGFSMATWISFVLSFLSAPITTRLLSPEVVGKNNMFSVYLALFSFIAYLGLDQTYVRFYNEKLDRTNKPGLLLLCLWGTLVTSFFVSIGILIFNGYISKEISGYSNWIVPICLIFSLFANIYLRYTSLYYRMAGNIFSFTVISVLITLIAKIFYLIVAFWDPSHYNSIIATTIGFVFVSIIYVVRRPNKGVEAKCNMGNMRFLLTFGIPLMPATIFAWLNNSIPQFMLKHYVDYSAIGIYSNAVAIAAIISLIQAGFNMYWSPFVYANYKTEIQKIKKVHDFITFAMIGMSISIIIGQDVIYLLLGEEFRSSKIFFPLLLLAPVCYTIAETTGIGINLSKKTYLNLCIFCIVAFVNLLLNYLLLPKMGLIGAAISVAISSVVMLFFKTIFGVRYYRSVRNYIKSSCSLCFLILTGVANVMFFENNPVKYSIFVSLLLILSFLYIKEVKYVFNILKITIVKKM